MALLATVVAGSTTAAGWAVLREMAHYNMLVGDYTTGMGWHTLVAVLALNTLSRARLGACKCLVIFQLHLDLRQLTLLRAVAGLPVKVLAYGTQETKEDMGYILAVAASEAILTRLVA